LPDQCLTPTNGKLLEEDDRFVEKMTLKENPSIFGFANATSDLDSLREKQKPGKNAALMINLEQEKLLDTTISFHHTKPIH
jgi:hypothetical protein